MESEAKHFTVRVPGARSSGNDAHEAGKRDGTKGS